MIFTYENQGSNTYLVYKVNETDTVDSMSLGMLANNRITGLVPAILQQLDNDQFIKYNVSATVSVKQFFSGPVKKQGLLKVFQGITDALLSAEEYMIDPRSILLDLDYIYTDVSTYDTQLICLPIMHSFQMDVDLKLLFQQIVFNTQFDHTENCDYVAQLINYLNSARVFSLQDFRMVLNTISSSGEVEQARGETKTNERMAEQVSSGIHPVQPAASELSMPNPAAMPNSSQRMAGTNSQNMQNAGGNFPAGQGMSASPQIQQSASFNPQMRQSASFHPQMRQSASFHPQMQQNAAAYSGMQSAAGQNLNFQQPALVNSKMQQPPAKNARQQVPPVESTEQQTFTGQAGNPPEKQISMFYLLQHYNKENAALYKSQKQAKKAASAKGSKNQAAKSAKSVPQNQNFDFPVPGQKPQAFVSNTAPQEPSRPVYQEQGGQGAAAVQMQNFSSPSQQNSFFTGQGQQTVQLQSNVLQSKPLNFGETTVLNAGKKGETTVLNAALVDSKPIPHLIRTKSSEKIELNKPVFRIGKEKSYVDYFISDNTAISRSHANVVTREGKFFLVDTNSTNHTYINGVMIQSNVETEIVHGTLIRLANEEFEFRVY